MQHDIFNRAALPVARETTDVLHTYQTPSWACEALVDRFYADLGGGDSVLEPTCGEGHFLDALPHDVPAIGIELDPGRAAIAMHRTGRHVIVGDVLTVEVAVAPTLIIGNPPFQADFLDALLDRAHAWLPDGGRCGLILPSYVFSMSPRVVREAARWSIRQDAIPRELFPNLRMPVQFVRFEKRRKRTMIGFALFTEMESIRQLTRRARHLLDNGRAPAWKAVVIDALHECGGEATLEALYRHIEGRRPTANPHWRAKIRQVVHHYAERTGKGRYALKGAD
jgi:hypothetical protein